MSDNGERELFMEVIETIQSRFPNLHTELITEHSHVEVFLEIPAQHGLCFLVSINLQCNEFHLDVGSFSCEWFPCSDKDIYESFIEAVCGLLSGTYRVVEYWRGGVALKAYLQRQIGDDWKHVATWMKKHIPISWGMSRKIILNVL